MNASWNKLKLSGLCKVFTDGNWIETKDQSSDGIRLIQTGNIGIGKFKNRKDKARYISNSTFKKLNCTEVFTNDILVSRLPDPVGRACIIPAINGRMITAVDCSIIRFDDKKIIPEYFNYYSQSLQYLSDVNKKTTGATRRRISRKNLGLIIIPLPTIPEQKRIVKILDKAFTAIEKAKANTEKNLQNTRELFESYLNKIFSNPGKDWEEKKLGECFKLKSGDGLTAKNMNQEGNIPVYGGNGIAGYHNEFNLSGSNIIVGRVGALCGNVRHINENIWLTDNAFKVIDFKYEFDNSFLTYLLNFKNLKNFARQAAQPVISNSSLKDILLCFPSSLIEQKKIVQKLDVLSVETKKLETIYQQKLNDLEELKKSILQKAFNGELETTKALAV